jgi:hypothetical protein
MTDVVTPNSPKQAGASVTAPTVPVHVVVGGRDSSSSKQQDSSTEQIIEKISNLQDLENRKYDELNVLLASNPTPDNIAQQKVLLNDITQLTKIRSSLFNTLLLHAQNNVKMNDTMNANVQDKHTIVTLKEDDLAARRAAVAALNQEVENTRRMVDINVYYKKQYEARVTIMKYIVLLCFLIIFFIVLMNLGWLPQEMVIVLVVIIIFAGGLYIGSLVYDMYKRSNMNFDEYNWGDFDSQKMASTISKQPKHKKKMTTERTCADGGDDGNGDDGGISSELESMYKSVSSSAATIEDSISSKATSLMQSVSGDGSDTATTTTTTTTKAGDAATTKVSESFMLSKVDKKYFSDPARQGLTPYTMEHNYGRI